MTKADLETFEKLVEKPRHVCPSCGLDESEWAWRDGWNELQPVAKAALIEISRLRRLLAIQLYNIHMADTQEWKDIIASKNGFDDWQALVTEVDG